MDVIETLQARINKLEIELNRIAGMAEQGAKMAKNDMDKRGLQAILRTAEAALEPKAAPAEPTIKVGDDVKVVSGEYEGRKGKVITISPSARDNYRVYLYTLGTSIPFHCNEIEPA